MAKVALCQSCGIPLDDKTARGTKKDGSLSEKYCIHCLENGEWTMQLAFDEMYTYNLNRFKESNMSKVEKFFIKRMYTKKFMKKLERWKEEE